eukprot:CAMPEP_0172026456 /NCGR_PEP_ID=MMETSP1041-20130122/16455_1 /TAXON_ID=464988 /ORGANISM="Hemiselmis andersenii, Strain CCMP439" /LENGTH=50 /DNA_ID=CAMNT_0012682249 /DNA_START=71 /DNA_END=219 /DNA_ORIENTATION=-
MGRAPCPAPDAMSLLRRELPWRIGATGVGSLTGALASPKCFGPALCGVAP